MNNLLTLLFIAVSGVFHIIGAALQFALLAFLALLAAPFALVLFIYHLFVENKKDQS